MKVRRALLSVFRKEGIVEFARGLVALGIEILSTGGTRKTLAESGVPVREVSDYTGFPELLDGRVKTLHPKIHGGILGRRDLEKHRQEMELHAIEPIDMVVVNLYPFLETLSRPGATHEELIENIDIGGPAMLRSAGKNFSHVLAVVDPSDYLRILEALASAGGEAPEGMRRELAAKAFAHLSVYDRAISEFLAGTEGPFSVRLRLDFSRVSLLRYGENPHQNAAFYREDAAPDGSVSKAALLHGKEMSYNNFLDADAALRLAGEFSDPAAVIVKHSNPCGVAMGSRLARAYLRAREADPVSAFGGVAALNRPVDEETAREISSTFMEVVLAPSFAPEALEVLKKKKDLRLLEVGPILRGMPPGYDFKRIIGGLLVQDWDVDPIGEIKSLKVVTERKPSDAEYQALAFAWKVAQHVKSNAIVFAGIEEEGDLQTIGIGAGQMSRVDSVRLAALKARSLLEGAVMASDAFFPFRDGIDSAAEEGITAVIQPGGSIRDAEVIAAANERKIAMLFSGIRHFRH